MQSKIILPKDLQYLSSLPVTFSKILYIVMDSELYNYNSAEKNIPEMKLWNISPEYNRMFGEWYSTMKAMQ